MQNMPFSDESVHSLQIDEDRCEGEDGQEPAKRMIGRQRSPGGCGKDIGCAKVRHVQVVRESDHRNQRATPDELPVLPVLVSSPNLPSVCQLHHGRVAVFREIEVALVPAEVLAHCERAEYVEANDKGQALSAVLQRFGEILHAVTGNQPEGNRFLECIIPLVILPVHLREVHLDVWPVCLPVEGLVALVEAHNPICFPCMLELAELHDDIPSIAITGLVAVEHVIPGQLAQETMEACHSRKHPEVKQRLRNVPFDRYEVRVVDVYVRRDNIANPKDLRVALALWNEDGVGMAR
mmetsp:Transcript_46188/g.107890  ORF Transcript_46188/g.107890 Transcript_46188/m.107890 type:complete len:294 (-) Transcript_46188:1847-2728(-)